MKSQEYTALWYLEVISWIGEGDGGEGASLPQMLFEKTRVKQAIGKLLQALPMFCTQNMNGSHQVDTAGFQLNTGKET